MSEYEIALLLTATAGVFAFITHHLLRMPLLIGMLFCSFVVAEGIRAFGSLGFNGPVSLLHEAVADLHYQDVVLHFMLPVLLFSAALHIKFQYLKHNLGIIIVLALPGVLLQSVFIAFAAKLLLAALGIQLSVTYSLILGAILAATDPIAVQGILKLAGVSASLETKIAGESLFNDGTAVAIVSILTVMLSGSTGSESALWAFVVTLLQELGGGLLLGFALGGLGFFLLKITNDREVELLLTIGIVAIGIWLALLLHVSAPIALGVAGLLLGNPGRSSAMSEATVEYLDNFWHTIDLCLNALLFVSIGLLVALIPASITLLLGAVGVVVISLIARFLVVAGCVHAVKPLKKRMESSFSPHVIKILTLTGVRGGVSVALALTLPATTESQTVLTCTYVVVLFSLLVQGLFIGRLIKPLLVSGEVRGH